MSNFLIINNSTTPQPTTLPWESFGKDYAQLRVEKRKEQQDRINNSMLPSLMERNSKESSKKEFMYSNI